MSDEAKPPTPAQAPLLAGSPAPAGRLETEIAPDLADVWFGEYAAVAVLLGALVRSPV